MHMLLWLHMKRTTIMLPEVLKHRAEQTAHSEGISLAELIRASLEDRLQKQVKRDPFFADTEVFSGETPTDLATHHDDLPLR